jgi:cell division protein FtsI (penicillin-binding protein 3)
MLANTDIHKIYFSMQKKEQFSQNMSAKESVSWRMMIVNILALMLIILLLLRLIYLNTYSNQFLAKQLNIRVERTITTTPIRGTIDDRNGNPLAVSTPVDSIWVDPSELTNVSQQQITQISNLLQLPINYINNKLNQKNRTFVYLKRAVSPEVALQIRKINLDGLYISQEFKRYYPNGEISAHIVGFNNIDDVGLAGIEYADNKKLIGSSGKYNVLLDRHGNVIEQLGVINPVQNGHNITLSIDNRIQYVAYNALKNQVTKLHASSGSVVILDAHTGEVLTMVNMPTYNPNNRNGVSLNALLNRAITNVYDPGSIIKPLVVAKALDDKIVNINTIFNTHPYYVGPKLIKDDEPAPQLTVANILIRSSDIGTSKIALKYKPHYLWNYFRTIGFGSKTNTGFPGETTGILLNWKKWHPIDQALMAYGYGISVSLFQMARAYTIFTNHGCMLPVSFYKQNANNQQQCTQIISPNTADTVRKILQDNTVIGTGKNAQLIDYTTAGKTGTAQKLVNGHYSTSEHISSFVGFAPATNPRIIVAITIDSPKGIYYGAAVAAPLFSQIAGPSLHILGVKPDRK